MESEKYVCIREDGAQGSSLTVVDLTNGNEVSRMPMAAESTIMNPEKKVVALRKGLALQVFDLESKNKVASFKLPDNSVVTPRRSPSSPRPRCSTGALRERATPAR